MASEAHSSGEIIQHHADGPLAPHGTWTSDPEDPFQAKVPASWKEGTVEVVPIGARFSRAYGDEDAGHEAP